MKENIIEIKDLVKSYWENNVLRSVDLEIKSWDFFALLWHNWAWKTTTINILTNLTYKTSGEVKIGWINIDKNFSEARKLIWVVPQEFNFDVFVKVKTIPLIQAWYYWISKEIAEERVEKYLKKLWLWEKRDSIARELSWWMKRRLMIVRALIHEPKILILDEPTAWVDVELRKTMWEFIKELNKSWITILLTTHYLEEVEALCRNVAIMHKWKIVENTSVKNLLTKVEEEVIIISTKDNNIKLTEEFEKKYSANILEDCEIELTVKKEDSINEVFKKLDEQKIEVFSFRNKTNRLEALFMKLLK